MKLMRRPEPSRSEGSPRGGFPARPSAPILLVVAAVVLIALATELSTVGVHTSLPGSVNLPSVAALAPSRRGVDPGPVKRTSVEAPRAEAAADGPTTSVSLAGSATGPAGRANTGPGQGVPVTPGVVTPEYPIGPGSGQAQESATPTDPSRSTTMAPVRPISSSQSSTTSVTDSTDDATQTVPPYYPVVTTPSGTTTTTTVPASTSPTTADH